MSLEKREDVARQQGWRALERIKEPLRPFKPPSLAGEAHEAKYLTLPKPLGKVLTFTGEEFLVFSFSEAQDG